MLRYKIIKGTLDDLPIKVSQKCEEYYEPVGRPFKTGIVYRNPKAELHLEDVEVEFAQAIYKPERRL